MLDSRRRNSGPPNASGLKNSCLSRFENFLQQWKGGRVQVKFSWWRSRRWGDETDCARQEATCRDRETASGESRQTHLYALVGGVVGGRRPRAAGSRRPGEHQRAATDRMVADLSQPGLGRPLRPALQRGPRQLDTPSGRATQGEDCQGAFPQFAADPAMARGYLRRGVFFLWRQGSPAPHWRKLSQSVRLSLEREPGQATGLR